MSYHGVTKAHMSMSPVRDLIIDDLTLSDASALRACRITLETASPWLLASSSKSVADDNVRQWDFQ